MERIVITAQCDPYNAKNHWYGQEVLKYDGSTPIKWIIEECDNHFQARKMLYNFAKNEPGFAEYDYDDALAYIRELERLEDIQFYANKFMECMNLSFQTIIQVILTPTIQLHIG